MKTLSRSFSLLLTLSILSCVTINIYFPAEQMRGAADKIVEEIWGDGDPAETKENTPQKPGSSFFQLLQPSTAFAAQDINVSTPLIRSIKDSIKQRSESLISYLESGKVGIGHDGLLALRDSEGINLKQRGQLNKLLKEENKDRLRLYQEIAVANGFPDKTGEVQSIFAESWRKQAHKGWFMEDARGNWAQK